MALVQIMILSNFDNDCSETEYGEVRKLLQQMLCQSMMVKSIPLWPRQNKINKCINNKFIYHLKTQNFSKFCSIILWHNCTEDIAVIYARQISQDGQKFPFFLVLRVFNYHNKKNNSNKKSMISIS